MQMQPSDLQQLYFLVSELIKKCGKDHKNWDKLC